MPTMENNKKNYAKYYNKINNDSELINILEFITKMLDNKDLSKDQWMTIVEYIHYRALKNESRK